MNLQKKSVAFLINEKIDKKHKLFKLCKELEKIYNIYYFVQPTNKFKSINTKNIIYVNNLKKIEKNFFSLKIKYCFDNLWFPDNKNNHIHYRSILKKNYKLRDIFIKNKIPLIRFSFSNLSKWNKAPLKYLRIFKLLLKEIKNKFSLPKWLQIPNWNIVVAQGNFPMQHINYFKSKLIYSHSLDYDHFIKSKDKKIKIKNYAVYIDQMIGEHPDNAIKSTSVNVKKEKFNEELKSLFYKLKKNFSLKVKISVHPKRKYFKNQELYGCKVNNRDTTYNLIKNSKLVLVHDSAAISFAVMFNKPIIFLVSDSINNSFYLDRIKMYAAFFNTKSINISKNIDSLNSPKIYKIDKTTYKYFKDGTIKHPSSEKIKISKQIEKALTF